MISKPQVDDDTEFSSGEPDSMVDLLIDARPEVTPLSSVSVNRILCSALQEATVSAPSPRVGFVGARFVISAALCVCAAAGMLLLRSMASERGYQQGTHANQKMAVRPDLLIKTHSSRFDTSRVFTHNSNYNKLAVMAQHRYSNHLSSVRRTDAVYSNCPAPPVPVCCMSTFAIFTPVQLFSDPRGYHEETEVTAEESLLVCIVSDDDTCETSGAIQKHDIDSEKTPDTSDDRYMNPFLSPREIADRTFVGDTTSHSNPSAQILVGAASKGFFDEIQYGATDAFVPHDAGIDLILPMYSYDTI